MSQINDHQSPEPKKTSTAKRAALGSARDWAIVLFLVNACLVLVVVFLLVWTDPGGLLPDWFPGSRSGSKQKVESGSPGSTNSGTSLPHETDPQSGSGVSGGANATPSSFSLLPFIERGPDQSSSPYPAPIDEDDLNWVDKTLAGMTLEQKIGQLMMIGIAGSGKDDSNCAVVQQVMPGAVFYQEGGNVNDPLQLRQFSADLEACLQGRSDIPILFAIDHEGQYIFRFKEQATMFPTAMAFGATDDPDLAYEAGLAAGQELLYSGVNMVLGPVADVLLEPSNGVLSVRSYGSDPQRVSDFIDAVVNGYREARVIPVLKHFPGHGGIAEDSHETLPIDSVDRNKLEQSYLPPFMKGIQSGAQVVMLGHLVFPQIDESQLPATLSPKIIDLLRQQIGFQGVVISDAMDMKAIKGYRGTVSQASLDAIRAGVDMVLINRPNQVQDVYQLLLSAARDGSLSIDRVNRAVRDVLLLKASNGLKSIGAEPSFGSIKEPDWKAHQKLDAKTGYRAITICRDRDGLVPLPQDKKRLLVIGPTPGWSFYDHLQNELSARGYQADFKLFDLDAASRTEEQLSYPKTLPDQAAGYDLTIIFTWHAFVKGNEQGDDYQIKLGKKMLNTGGPVLVVALRAPNDLLAFPEVRSLLLTYGHTDGGEQGLMDVLFGDKPAIGKNPLSGLPCDPVTP